MKIKKFDRDRAKFCVWVNHSSHEPEFASQIKDAWLFVRYYQDSALRRDGNSVMSHLEAVAKRVHFWRFDFKFVIAALLHDILEDCSEVTLEDIKKRFGCSVADMVDFMSKNILGNSPNYDHKVSVYLKDHPHFIFLRLADNLHNIINYQSSRSPESLQRNCQKIIELLEIAAQFIKIKPKLQKNRRLLKDLETLKEMALDHLTD